MAFCMVPKQKNDSPDCCTTDPLDRYHMARRVLFENLAPLLSLFKNAPRTQRQIFLSNSFFLFI